jgi:hypothetical protein
MKKYLIIILLLIITIVLNSCKDGTIVSSSENISKEVRDISYFDEINVEDGFLCFISYGEVEKIEIEANENLHQYIEVKVEKDELEVEIKDKIIFDNKSLVKVYITYNKLKKIDASGGSKITFENEIKQTKLKIDLNGGSVLNAQVNCQDLEADVSGGGKLNLTGKTGYCKLELSGGSSSESYDFAIDNLVCEISGGGVVNHTVNKTIEIDASGGSTLSYKGDALITKQDLSGGSSVVKK